MIAVDVVHDWLPGPVRGELPLSLEELRQLYAFNLVLTDDDLAELALPLPYRGDVLSPEQFNTFVLDRGYVVASRALSPGKPDAETDPTFERRLAAVADLCGPSPARVVTNLKQAVYDLSADDYEAAYQRLIELTEKHETYRRRNALLARLAIAAPTWATAIAAKRGVHSAGEIPGDAVAAWEWRRTHQHQS